MQVETRKDFTTHKAKEVEEVTRGVDRGSTRSCEKKKGITAVMTLRFLLHLVLLIEAVKGLLPLVNLHTRRYGSICRKKNVIVQSLSNEVDASGDSDFKFSEAPLYEKKEVDIEDKELSFPENDNDGEEYHVPRLHADLDSLNDWIKENGGTFDAQVKKSSDGWSLFTSSNIEKGEIIMRIPKSLCIHSNFDGTENHLLESTQKLMACLNKKHWRARLAIALLSERVRESSHYKAYLRNLPFEFWGLPIFFSTSEFNLIQDISLMQETRDRCKFLSDFAQKVLLPLHGTENDPFSGNRADVNAFGWGFACASSRALRNFPSGEEEEKGAVMIPGIDLASHSIDPNCEVVSEGDFYLLVSLRKISLLSEKETEKLTISYGALNNNQLLSVQNFCCSLYNFHLVIC